MNANASRAIRRSEVLSRLKAMEPRLRALGLRSLHVFGSTARDDARPDSDVDVFVEFETGAAIGWDFAGAPELLGRELGRPVDLTTRRALHPFLREDIEREAVRVF
jgi:predicted nucleotidyltransferase